MRDLLADVSANTVELGFSNSARPSESLIQPRSQVEPEFDYVDSARNVRVSPAESFADLCFAYRIAHDEYLRCGYTESHPSGMRYTALQLLRSSLTLVAKVGDSVIGTGSVVLNHYGELPCRGIFNRELERLECQGRVVSEGTLLACNTHQDTAAHITSSVIIRWGICWADALNADDFCVVVNPKHLQFWHKRLGFEILGHSTSCQHVKGHEGVLLRLDLRKLREEALQVTPLFKRIMLQHWVSGVRYRTNYRLKDEDVAVLLVKRPELLRCSPYEVLEVLRSRFPFACRVAEKEEEFQEQKLAA